MQRSENERLKILRKYLKLTQQQFADALALTQGGYSDAERGKSGVSRSLKRIIENLYGTLVLDWLEGRESGPLEKLLSCNGNITYKANINQRSTNYESIEGVRFSDHRVSDVPFYYIKFTEPRAEGPPNDVALNETLKEILLFAQQHLPFSNAPSREVQEKLAQINQVLNAL